MKVIQFRWVQWIMGALLLVVVLVAAALCTPYPVELVRALREKPVPEVRIIEKRVEVPVEVRVEVPVPVSEGDTAAQIAPQPWEPQGLVPQVNLTLPPFPPVLPEKLSTGTFEQVTSLAKDLHLRSSVSFSSGTTASRDREKKQAYQIRIALDLLVPHAADARELLFANPDLPAVLQDYRKLLEGARVSHWFYALYRHKQNQARRAVAALSQPLNRHNFYDTDTILEITAPGSRRRVLWIQADMDVVSDGSDGDRLPTMPDSIRKSDYYQPMTSYRWRKRTAIPNPLLPSWEARLAKLLKDKSRNAAAIDDTRRVIWDIKRYSFLLAQYDPFIVVPLVLKEGRDDSFRPQPGDYAVVIVGKNVYPAIVGDFGPRYKTGEASLRLGKLVNPKADVYARPVSSLGASYLIFPHSKEPENGPIDYKRLNSRCRKLLDELGGLKQGSHFVEVDDLLAPKPSVPEQKLPTGETKQPADVQGKADNPVTEETDESRSPASENSKTPAEARPTVAPSSVPESRLPSTNPPDNP